MNCYDVVTVDISEHKKELDSTIPQLARDQIFTVQSNSFELYLKSLKDEFCSLLQYIGTRCSYTEIRQFSLELTLVSRTLYAKLIFDYLKERQDIEVSKDSILH